MGLTVRGGAVISDIEAGSAAARAGLAPGDVVVEVNGQPVLDADDLRNLIGLMPVGPSLPSCCTAMGASDQWRRKSASEPRFFWQRRCVWT